MVPVIAAGLRRDLAHVRAEERAAAKRGDELAAMTRCIEAADIAARIAEHETWRSLTVVRGKIEVRAEA